MYIYVRYVYYLPIPTHEIDVLLPTHIFDRDGPSSTIVVPPPRSGICFPVKVNIQIDFLLLSNQHLTTHSPPLSRFRFAILHIPKPRKHENMPN